MIERESLSICLAASESHGAVADAVHVTVGLLAIAAVIGVLTKFVRIPYTIALVLAGVAIAALGLAPEGVFVTQDLVLLLFLPPLLFQAGLHTELSVLRKAWAPVLIMAIPGVLVTSFAVAAAVRPFIADAMGTDANLWLMALLFGVVVAPTDPISVMATFKTAGAPTKLKTVVEGESLFNDGTAVALFLVLKTAVVGVIAGGTQDGEAEAAVSFVEIATSFVTVTGIGTFIGLALGLLTFFLLRRLEDHTLETAITIALAWGSFVVAEMLHASGVIAVVVSALIMGNYGKTFTMSAETRTTLTGFWDSLDFVINSILFLLIGFELTDPAVGGVRRLLDADVMMTAGAAIVAMFVARALLVYPVALTLKSYWPKGWKHVIWWAGLRGSLSLALILGLPPGELRSFLAPVIFLIVLVSLIGQGLTMPLLLRATGVSDEADDEPRVH